jgi:hypothetical protein
MVIAAGHGVETRLCCLKTEGGVAGEHHGRNTNKPCTIHCASGCFGGFQVWRRVADGSDAETFLQWLIVKVQVLNSSLHSLQSQHFTPQQRQIHHVL